MEWPDEGPFVDEVVFADFRADEMMPLDSHFCETFFMGSDDNVV